MRRTVSWIIFLLSQAIVMIVSGCSPKRENGHFYYIKALDGYEIYGLTEEGQKLEKIEFPRELDGHKITILGGSIISPGSGPGTIKSEVLKEVIIPETYSYVSGGGGYFTMRVKLKK